MQVRLGLPTATAIVVVSSLMMAAALIAITLAAGATGPIEWESLRPLPLDVCVVDARTQRPIHGAELAILGFGADRPVVVDRGHTDRHGKRRLYAQVRIKLGGTLYQNFFDPRFELDYQYLPANVPASLFFPDEAERPSIDGWNLTVEADGYEPLGVRLADHLPRTSTSIDPAFPEISLALVRRAE
jgi:hypothetical protein